MGRGVGQGRLSWPSRDAERDAGIARRLRGHRGKAPVPPRRGLRSAGRRRERRPGDVGNFSPILGTASPWPSSARTSSRARPSPSSMPGRTMAARSASFRSCPSRRVIVGPLRPPTRRRDRVDARLRRLSSLDELFVTIPEPCVWPTVLDMPDGLSESDTLAEMERLADRKPRAGVLRRRRGYDHDIASATKSLAFAQSSSPSTRPISPRSAKACCRRCSNTRRCWPG